MSPHGSVPASHESVLAALAANQREFREASGAEPEFREASDTEAGKRFWSSRTIKTKVVLDESGTPVGVHEGPWEERLPQKAERTGKKISASLLADNAAYSLGISDDGVNGWSRDCHEAFCRLHREAFAGVPAAAPLLRFCEADPEDTLENHHIRDNLKKLSGGFVGFLVQDSNGKLTDPADDRGVVEAANGALGKDRGEVAVCAVTGAVGPVARTHPKRKFGTQNACLVNGDKKSMLHWTSKENKHITMAVAEDVARDAAEALERLAKDPSHHCDIPGSKKGAARKLIWWADGADRELAEALSTACSLEDLTFDMGGNSDREERCQDLDMRLTEALTRAARGSWAGPDVDDPRVHVAVISSNVSRLICEMAVTGSATEILGRIADHQRALSIERTEKGVRRQARCLSFYGELDGLRRFPKDPAPWRARLMTRLVSAVLTGRPYPPELAQRALALCGPKKKGKLEDRWSVVEAPCARIIKADLIRNHGIEEESMTIDGNPAEQPQAMGLGRLLSVCEEVQKAVSPNARPLSGSFFTAASTVPASVFPNIITQTKVRLSKLRKEKPAYAVSLERRLGDLVVATGVAPTQFTAVEREQFCLGFYLEEQIRWTKRDTEESPDEDPETA
ncbi:type I-C CRISPR-associated protein Cas8c/Csd1 [Caniella muris]|uniref:type I-C CRISPR-associated protein Cas8c/Csd1 n=1 Tax=Caniella muris TaxID=2941502 RepID=UPI00203FE606|nr:type I-C CRISPR-associated protein Cas8c/Csd1 [Caniella muris]